MKIKARYVPAPEAAPLTLQYAREAYVTARAEAATGIARARSKVARGMTRWKKRGWSEGFEAGKAAGLKEVLSLSLSLQREYEAAVEDARLGCLELACCIAEEIIGKEVSTNHDFISREIAKTIDGMLSQGGLVVRAAPGEARALKARLKGSVEGQTVTVIADRSVNPGNARVRSVAGEIELSWKNHLSILREQLFSNLPLHEVEGRQQ